MSTPSKSDPVQKPGTRVESAKVFSIIAHELRSPLGVIQGYARMLRSRRADDDPEIRMLTGILDATARISAAARHAADLAAWTDGTPSADSGPVSMTTVLQRVAESESLLRPVAVDGAAPVLLGGHAAALTGALTALVIWLQRNRPDDDIRITAAGEIIAMRPAPAAMPASVSTDAEARARERLFTGGGQGLSLILARTVLDHHRIAVGLIETPTDIVVLHLPKD